MITKYSDLKISLKRLKSNQSYIISKGMENEDINVNIGIYSINN